MDEDLRQHYEARHDWIEQLGAQDRHVTSRGYHRLADLRVSTTDHDATLMPMKNGAHMGYRTQYVVDGGKARIISEGVTSALRSDGQSTDARSALARPLPLETLAQTGAEVFLKKGIFQHHDVSMMPENFTLSLLKALNSLW